MAPYLVAASCRRHWIIFDLIVYFFEKRKLLWLVKIRVKCPRRNRFFVKRASGKTREATNVATGTSSRERHCVFKKHLPEPFRCKKIRRNYEFCAQQQYGHAGNGH